MTRTRGRKKDPRTVEDAMEDAVKRGYVMRVGGGREGSAAANLAACMIGGPSCTQTRHDERIRALDAELAALEKGAVEGSWRFRAEAAEARVKELMELVEIAATYVKTPIDKEQILDMLRNPNWREEWERKDAELREEDRG